MKNRRVAPTDRKWQTIFKWAVILRSDFLGEDRTKVYVNREHKDTVFRMLFGNRRNLKNRAHRGGGGSCGNAVH